MKTVLIAGATGMLGSSIATHLLDQNDVTVRLLVRSTVQHDVDKQTLVDRLVERGADVVVGDVTEPASLDAATQHVDVVISALQGGADIIVDGQIALAEAAVRNGVRRFIPSDFAIDLFAAPAGAPQFDIRKQADEAIDKMPFQVVHVLNGAFMDMMLDPNTAGIVDLGTNTARMWGTGDERFNLTTVDDTARFTAMVATDDADVSGVRKVSGSETSFNEIIAKTEQLIGATVTKHVLGDADDLRTITSAADDPWSVVMQWYFLCMITVPAFNDTDNDRYADLDLTTLDDYLSAAHRQHHTV
jgi:nucleoside-diphosphate-sugar epimerase